MTTTILLLALAALVILVYMGKTYGGIVTATGFIFYAWYDMGPEDMAFFKLCAWVAATVAVVVAIPALRQKIISRPMMKIARKTLPSMGETEKIALDAGSVWFDGDLFSGSPDWRKLMAYDFKKLTAEEQAFIDGPTEELCAMIDDWQIAQERDLPKPVWDFIKKHKFLGMVIPKEFGGLGFSAIAHSEVITRISSRSVTAGVTIMVPNSLGPGELLTHYGTKEQKEHYLPRLAVGKEIPCFALTEPHAGSDAASMRSVGTVCKGKFEGKEVVGIKLNFNKRYITLAPIATVLGMAFKLYDPDKLLGDKEDLGITCALIPRETKGVTIGNRHDPMGLPFMNGPIQGEDVFIPMDWIIGGAEYAGKGWMMLMEQLAAGRGISLPSLSVSAVEVGVRAIGAYGNVREQFGIPISRMEGVRETAASIAGHAYFMDAVRRMTCAAVDMGERPSVATAIAKAYLTEGMRKSVNDAMDIQGGAAICRGPKNIFARGYDGIPIGITVEGSNTLTRSMIIFGQGAVRCHPYMQNMVRGLTDNDVAMFDAAMSGFTNHMAKNTVRSFVYGITGGMFITPPKGSKKQAKAYKRLTHLSTNFALLADMALISMGGSLKQKEHISGRFADALSWMFICASALKRFHDDGHKAAHKPLLDWTLAYGMKHIEEALHGITRNMPSRVVGLTAHALIFPFGRRYELPCDKLVSKIADSLFDPESSVRDDLTGEIFIPSANEPSLGMLEAAFKAVTAAAPIRKKVDKARRHGKIVKADVPTMANKAKELGLIDDKELKQILAAEAARDSAVQVDNFDYKAYSNMR